MFKARKTWIEVSPKLLDDVRQACLTDQERWRFIQLALLAGKCDADGALVIDGFPMTNEEISWRLRCDTNTFDANLKTLVSEGLVDLVEIDDDLPDCIWVSGFDTRERGAHDENERETKTEAGGLTPLMDDIVKELGLISAAVWGCVWRHAQHGNNVCTASIETIANALGLSKRTIIRHLQTLLDRGYLKDYTPGRKNVPHEYGVIMPDELTTSNSRKGAKLDD